MFPSIVAAYVHSKELVLFYFFGPWHDPYQRWSRREPQPPRGMISSFSELSLSGSKGIVCVKYHSQQHKDTKNRDRCFPVLMQTTNIN